jgi:uncharacterized protein (DUF488 family)
MVCANLAAMPAVLTIGHSNHSLEHFLELLQGAGVEMVADVRSTPASRRQPQFNKAPLAQALHAAGLSYLWLGRELGGRPADPALFTDGIADFERMAETKSFREGIARVLGEADWLRLVLMCAEKAPLDCHRCLLVGRVLSAQGADVHHIMADGTTISQTAIEDELLGADELFPPREERLAAAYRARARKIAFRDS